jgi:hypothetical protein
MHPPRGGNGFRWGVSCCLHVPLVGAFKARHGGITELPIFVAEISSACRISEKLFYDLLILISLDHD